MKCHLCIICYIIFFFSSLSAASRLGMLKDGTYTIENYTIISYTNSIAIVNDWDELVLYNNVVAVVKFFEDEQEYLIPIASPLANEEELSQELKNFISLAQDIRQFDIVEKFSRWGPQGPRLSDYRLGDTSFFVEDPWFADCAKLWGEKILRTEFYAPSLALNGEGRCIHDSVNNSTDL